MRETHTRGGGSEKLTTLAHRCQVNIHAHDDVTVSSGRSEAVWTRECAGQHC